MNYLQGFAKMVLSAMRMIMFMKLKASIDVSQLNDVWCLAEIEACNPK